MILVTGATGHLGRGILENLLGRVPADEIVACAREPDKAADLAARGVAVRAGDFADANSLEAAFRGVDQVLIVSVDKLGEEAARLHRSAIGAACKAGARRILYTSHMGARLGSAFEPTDQHAATEADLAATGIPYSSLRHGFYLESCLQLIREGVGSGVLQTPEDGPVSWTSRADLAEADAAILAGSGGWDGKTPPLTSGEALTMGEVAAIASDVLGREVRHVMMTDEAWRDARIAAGMPAMYADLLLGMFRAARHGDFAATDPALELLLGRKPKTLRDALWPEGF